MNPWVLVIALIVTLLVVLAWACAELRRHSLSRRLVSQQEYYNSLNRLGFQSLEEYLKSDLWRATKRRYRSSDYPQRCLICGSSEIDLHHRSYARLGEEELFDLVPLCHRHHDQLHELIDPNPKLCVKDTHDYLVFLREDDEGPDKQRRRDRQRQLGFLREDEVGPVNAREVAPTSADAPAFSGGDDHDTGTPAKIKQKQSRAGKRWSAEDDAALLSDFDRGIPLKQLAERLRRGVMAVKVRLFKLGRLSLADMDSHGPARPLS
ncbi:MAG: hypothetical protein NT013_18875 [Planctomycetia bacterium]|nr:hypothetical protein [Planctomycetia bacterium]